MIAEYDIRQGNVLDELRALPSESVHCVVTSPPYWGLRDYGLEPVVWGGDPDCEHQWGSEMFGRKRGHPGDQSTLVGTQNAMLSKVAINQGQLCECGAWLGSLGLEPTIDLYIEHIVLVFRELWRVLRADGTCWLNMGDSYYNGDKGGYHNKRTSTRGTIQAGNPHSDFPGAPNRQPQEGWGLKPKDAVMMPAIVSLALRQPYYTGRIKRGQDRAWLSAMIDGEGTIAGFDAGGRTGVSICVANSSIPLLDEVQRIWPASLHRVSDNEHRLGKRELWRWTVNGIANKQLLIRELYPHLIAKKQQALLAYNLLLKMEDATKLGRGGQEEAVKEYRRSLASMMSRLNKGEDVDLPDSLVEPPTVEEPTGWWVRRPVIWHKDQVMPESVDDRPTNDYELIYFLAKSGDSLFWTHRRELYTGVRSKPEPDHIFVHRDTEEERRDQPPGDNWRDDWKRINLWKSWDYYYDSEAVTEEQSPNTHARVPQSGGKPKVRTRHAMGRGIKHNANYQESLRDAALPSGRRRLRSVWRFKNQKNPGHIASFPEAVPERCLLLGTSERGVCPSCGAPWARVVGVEYRKTRPSAGNDSRTRGEDSLSKARGKAGYRGNNMVRETVTKGWVPTCEHGDLEPQPAVVLDPFSGSGTTGVAALKQGRNYIGIELNPKYAQDSRDRIENHVPPMFRKEKA